MLRIVAQIWKNFQIFDVEPQSMQGVAFQISLKHASWNFLDM